MSKPQFSKRERGKKNAGKWLPPFATGDPQPGGIRPGPDTGHTQKAPTYGYCPDCQRPIWNKGAHAEACDGQPIQRCEARTRAGGAFGILKQCLRPWGHQGGHIY